MFGITDYDKRYKPTNKSGGELKNADYVKLPVKPKGDGLQTLLEQKNGLEVFAIWCLLLEKATDQKPENRGKLLNHKDEPADFEEIAQGISLKGKGDLVGYAINLLITMGWIYSTDVAEISSEKFRKGVSKISKDKISKGKVREGKKHSSANTKKQFLDFVFLTEVEHKKLIERFGKEKTDDYIERLNNGIGSKGYTYKSHYYTILNWSKKDSHIVPDGKTRLFPIHGKVCGKKGCGLPAVYKSAGEFDHYYCAEHMPDKVKEKYYA